MKAADLVWIVVVIGILFLNWTLGNTEVIPERAEVYYVNEKYLSNAFLSVRRYARRSPYYINFGGTVLVAAGDNVTLYGVAYEFLHNEYKRGFVEVKFKMCDLLNKSPWKEMVGSSIVAQGIACPLQPDVYEVHNLSISLEKLPFVMPFEKMMIEGYAKVTATEEIIVRTRFYASLKRDLPRGK